jgi:hypothetical protein
MCLSHSSYFVQQKLVSSCGDVGSHPKDSIGLTFGVKPQLAHAEKGVVTVSQPKRGIDEWKMESTAMTNSTV